MNVSIKLRTVAAEILRLADELDKPVTVPDLFSCLAEAEPLPEIPTVKENPILKPKEEPSEEWPVEVAPGVFSYPQPGPAKRNYNRVGCKMAESMLVPVEGAIGKASGFCMRTDIERTLARCLGRTREDVRTAVNRAAGEMHLTCFVRRGYRYYRIIDRKPLMERAGEILKSA